MCTLDLLGTSDGVKWPSNGHRDLYLVRSISSHNRTFPETNEGLDLLRAPS